MSGIVQTVTLTPIDSHAYLAARGNHPDAYGAPFSAEIDAENFWLAHFSEQRRLD